MSTDSIFNFIRISERIATGGQPTKAQLETARSEGCQAVVNLAPDAENQALPDEAEVIRSLGMAYHHIPVEWTRPQTEQFDAFVAAMQSLRDQKILVHCAANFRVTVFYSLYAMKHEGWSAAQADELIAKIWESRPDYKMDDTWKSFIDGVRKSLALEVQS